MGLVRWLECADQLMTALVTFTGGTGEWNKVPDSILHMLLHPALAVFCALVPGSAACSSVVLCVGMLCRGLLCQVGCIAAAMHVWQTQRESYCAVDMLSAPYVLQVSAGQEVLRRMPRSHMYELCGCCVVEGRAVLCSAPAAAVGRPPDLLCCVCRMQHCCQNAARACCPCGLHGQVHSQLHPYVVCLKPVVSLVLRRSCMFASRLDMCRRRRVPRHAVTQDQGAGLIGICSVCFVVFLLICPA